MMSFAGKIGRWSQLSIGFVLLLSGCSWIGPHVYPREPGLDDLVVYDPGTHERGLPAVQFKEKGDGGLDVEIPPAVHVHRYYYSGDKEFQGPLIPGGPTIVVAKHPKTGEQMKIDVVLPSGAPIITHSKKDITYVFADRRVEIRFGRLCNDQVRVKHLSGRGAARQFRDRKEEAKERIDERIAGSELYRTSRKASKATGEMVSGGVKFVGDFVSQTAQLAGAALNIMPGVAALRGRAEEVANERRDSAIQLAQDKKEEAETKYLPTLR